MATIREIADLAGVSRGTVDRVLNHRGSVNADTRKRVLEVAEKLNYHPNQAGVALASQKRNLTIGVVLFGDRNEFFDDVVRGMKQKKADLDVYGIRLIIRRIPYGLETELSAIDELVQEGISALLLSPYDDPEVQKRIDSLAEKGIPCVTTNTDLPASRRIAYVGSDFYRCGIVAASLLHRFTRPLIQNPVSSKVSASRPLQVGIITGSHDILCHEDRIRGFLDQLQITEPDANILDIIEAHDDGQETYAAIDSLMRRFPDLDALYFTAGGMYGGCRRILEEKKHPIVLGFDEVPSTVEMMRAGVITAVITQEPELQGSVSLSILQAYLIQGILPKNPVIHTNLSVKIPECLA